jgi:hypothetical protein
MDVRFELNSKSEREIFRKLRELPDEAQAKTLQSAAKLTLNKLVNAARNNIDSKTGTLSKSIGSKIKIYNRGSVLYGLVGIDVNYSQEIDGELKIPNFYAGKIEMTQAFMRKAWESEKGKIQANFEAAIERKIKNYIRKNGV